jgi:hypothetical protein
VGVLSCTKVSAVAGNEVDPSTGGVGEGEGDADGEGDGEGDGESVGDELGEGVGDAVVGVGDGAAPVTTTSCGANAPLSRESKSALSLLVEVTPMLNVPLPLTRDVTLTSDQVFAATRPNEPSTAPSIAGWVAQVTDSGHVVLVIDR